MHDLNTINRLNYEAFVGSVRGLQEQGKFVVGHYEGLHLMKVETFEDEAAALTAQAGPVLAFGERRVLFKPVAAQ